MKHCYILLSDMLNLKSKRGMERKYGKEWWAGASLETILSSATSSPFLLCDKEQKEVLLPMLPLVFPRWIPLV